MQKQLCEELKFPFEATESLSRWEQKIVTNHRWNGMFQASLKDYDEDGQAHLEILELLAKELGASVYEVHLVLLLRCALALRQKYAEQGLPDALFLETMQDLRYKLLECYQVYGVWGNAALAWNKRFFRMERFQLGRLQYEVKPWTGPGYGTWLEEGKNAFWCHIPSCGPCTPELVYASLKRAYQFNIQGVFAVGCKSWILYPPHFSLFQAGGNLDKFRRLFTVFDQKERENIDLWRIFGVPNDADLKTLPEDTSLQRSFAKWLRQGNVMGCGVGVLLFDGEKILTLQEKDREE